MDLKDLGVPEKGNGIDPQNIRISIIGSMIEVISLQTPV